MASTAAFVKHYSQKSVQTELPAFLEPSPVITSIGVNGIADPAEGAYMQFPFTDKATTYYSDVKNYNGIPAQRPSTLQTRSARISSLPDHKVSEHDPIHPTRRIVSMPDSYVDNVTHRTRYMHDIHFPDEPGYRGDSGGRRQFIDDFPRTPSPSSPDSITIIGNNIHVPDLLHRPETRNPDWTSWASSPPKPIPALHGPLSLPYARCPSGAEGTVIEGDDLPHKIWGLGLDDAQSQSKTARSTPAPQAQQWASNPWHRASKQDKSFSTRYHTEGVINLAEPQSVLLTKELHRSVFKASSNFDELSSHASARSRPPSVQHNHTHSIDLATLAPRQDFMRQELASMAPRYPYPSLENLHHVQSSLSAYDLRASGRLNTGAQVFIPSNANPVLSAGSREVMKEFPSAISFLGNTQRNRSESELPTPPATVSPEWSPVFRYPALPSLTSISGLNKLLDNPLETSLQNLSILDSCGYSPYLDGFDDHSASLMAYMRQLREQDVAFNRLDSHLDVRHSTRSSGLPTVGSRTYRSNNSVINNLETSSTEGAVRQHMNNNLGQEREQLSASDRRNNLTSQHPRSIPLARLIQRRLSSVVEEDSFTDKLLPVHKQRPVYVGGQPRPPRGASGFKEATLGNCESKVKGTNIKSETTPVVESDGSSITSNSSGVTYHRYYNSARGVREGQNGNVGQKPQGDGKPNRGDAHKKRFRSKRREEGVVA